MDEPPGDDMTLEQLDRCVANMESQGTGGGAAVYRQLAASMREVEALKHDLGRHMDICAESTTDGERMRKAIANLVPLRDIDWHGKWRVHRCLDAAGIPNEPTSLEHLPHDMKCRCSKCNRAVGDAVHGNGHSEGKENG